MSINVVALILSLLNAFVLLQMARRILHSYQLDGYRIDKLYYWYKNTNSKYISRLAMVSFFSAGGLVVTNVLFRAYADGLFAYIGLVFYVVIGGLFIDREMKLPKKKKLVMTARMTRLHVAVYILSAVATYFLFVGSKALADNYPFFVNLRFAPVALTPVVLPLIVGLGALILYPFERFNNLRYLKKTTKVIADRDDLIKIGITGSYGKTSVKFILQKMLSTTFSTIATPSSFNTPMGIARSVKKLKPTHKIFIAEMGARRVGDISELCNMIHPQYAVITGVTAQHLDTFKSIDNVIKTKGELLSALDEKGVGFINGDSKYVDKITGFCKCEKHFSSTTDSEAYSYVNNVNCGKTGSKFTLHVDGKSVDCTTKLIGLHHISNIALCAGVAYRLGVKIEDIAHAVSELNPVPHRLELVENKNGITVLDDSFNANVEGTRSALDVLGMFEGRKVIVTPGMVELGAKEKAENRDFGRRIAKVCDLVVLIGQERSKPIHEGLLDEGFDEGKILVYSTLHDAKIHFKEFLRSGDTVLLENDLPDNYSEVDDKVN